MVYAARIDGREQRLTFQVSGMLWNRSLVMRDLETGSLWSHILGECMEGELRGTRLEIVPSELVTWEAWLREHPETTALDLPRSVNRSRHDFSREFYQEWHEFVLGIVLDGAARAYPFSALRTTPVVNDRISDAPVLVTFDPGSTRARIFDRRLDGKELSFERQGDRLLDLETRSLWNPATGEALSGPAKGKFLAALPGIPSYLRSWRVFHPSSTYYRPRLRL